MAMNIELLKIALGNLMHERVRSYLTLLGIIIGIAAIVALMSVAEGMNIAISEQFEKMGADTLIVHPGSSFIQSTFAKLQKDDADKIASLKGVESATPIYMKVTSVSYRDEAKSTAVIGIRPGSQENLSAVGMLELQSGRRLENTDTYGLLVGNNFDEKAYEKELGIKNRLIINGKSFKIIGITKPAGQSFGAFFDNAIIMNEKTLKAVIDENATPFRISVKATSSAEVEPLKQRIRSALKKAHNNEEDFQVINAGQILEGATSVLLLIEIVLVGIAAISLLVGGIGIMNTMLMAVIERTREIGIMKAIGATNAQVLSLFLVESGLIGLIGGIIGIALGLGIAFAISIIANSAGFGLPAIASPLLIAGAMLFAVMVGIISGVIPARRAALLDPVEALRQQ